MDNEKLFVLMTKTYSEMQNGFSEVKKRLEKLEIGQLTLENEIKETKKTLLDGYFQNIETIKRIEMKIDELSEKVDRHDIKIQVI